MIKILLVIVSEQQCKALHNSRPGIRSTLQKHNDARSSLGKVGRSAQKNINSEPHTAHSSKCHCAVRMRTAVEANRKSRLLFWIKEMAGENSLSPNFESGRNTGRF